MNDGFYPVCVVPVVPNGSGVRFMHPKAQYDVEDYATEIWAILSQCNGYEPLDVVVKRAAAACESLDTDTAESVISDLRTLGVLVDSREQYAHFHQLSQNPMFFSQSVTFDEIREYTATERAPIKKGDVFQLGSGNGQVRRLLNMRRSCRSFTAEVLSMDAIGDILTSAYVLSQHSTPSAGGLYPLKMFLIVTRDGGLAKGYYEFDPEKCEVVRYEDDPDFEGLMYALDSDTLMFGAAAIIVIAADLKRQPGKYSNRGYRYTVLEAGHVAQNIHLAAAENGVATLEYGGFLDDVLASELGFDEPSYRPLITVSLGIASSEPAFDAMHVLESLEKKLVGRTKPVNRVQVTSGNHPQKGDSFFAATAHYKSNGQVDTKRSCRKRHATGTATSAALAQVKAIAEAYERYASGLVRTDVTATAGALDAPWLDPRKVVPYTSEQYAMMPYLQVFDPDAEWQWVRGRRASHETVYVPADLVFYPLRTETFGRKLCYEANSSGVAAFTYEDEAVRRGLLELVERHSVMESWLTRRTPSHIDLSSLPARLRKRAEYWSGKGRETYVLDQSVYGVSVANVVIVSDSYPCFVNGAAASVDSFEDAAMKAFHEAELGLLDSLKSPVSKRVKPESLAHPIDHARLYAHPDHIGHISWLWGGIESPCGTEPSAEVESLLDDLDVTVVRLSPQNSPLSVVRVLSEKLVPINFGYGTEHFSHPAIAGSLSRDSLSLPHYFA